MSGKLENIERELTVLIVSTCGSAHFSAWAFFSRAYKESTLYFSNIHHFTMEVVFQEVLAFNHRTITK
jgi:hypothetical protein